jgi:3-oxoacyl-[acyl-carrier protein] reductase
MERDEAVVTTTFDFTGRSVTVTGAAQGIGHAIARAFLDAGARVAVIDSNETALLKNWADQAGRPELLSVHTADVGDTGSAERTVERILDRCGQVDILVNNAGITRDSVIWKMTPDDFDAVLRVHLGGTFNFTRCVIPGMRAAGFGRIVNVTSYTGMHGNIGQANYAAAKAGIIGLTKTVAKEVARFGITVNAVSPNAATAMVAGIPADKLAALTSAIPQGRFAEPSEIATAVAFLAAEEAGYITGAVLPVDGGMSM